MNAVGMSEHAHKKVRELSHGMTQLFSSGRPAAQAGPSIFWMSRSPVLDPVNQHPIEGILLEEKERGAAIVFSTHQMTDVEELSDRVLMIDGGEVALEGAPSELRRRYRGDTIRVESPDELPESISGAGYVERSADAVTMRLAEGATAERVLKEMLDAGMRIERFEVHCRR